MDLFPGIHNRPSILRANSPGRGKGGGKFFAFFFLAGWIKPSLSRLAMRSARGRFSSAFKGKGNEIDELLLPGVDTP